MNSDMSMRTIDSSVSNRNSASALQSSVLPTPVGPRNRNEPFGRRGSERPARERRMAFDDDLHRLVLADDALVQRLFHAQQFFLLALEHLRDGNAGPLGNHFGDFLFGHLVADELGFLGLGDLRLRELASRARESPRTGCCATAVRSPLRRAASISCFTFSCSSRTSAAPCSEAFSLFQISSRSEYSFSRPLQRFLQRRRGASSWPRPSPS